MENINNQAVDFLNYNPHEVEAPGRDSRFILKIPGPDKPLICKVIPDPRNGNGRAWYRSLRQFQYLIGPNRDTDTRNKVCMSFFGERSPENDFYWECRKKLSELKKLGKGNSVDAQKLEVYAGEKGLFKPKEGGWLLVIEPESPIVKAVRVPITVIQLLTGKDATEHKPAIPSLIKSMASEGVSPFDIKQQKPKIGWIKIYKTGEKLATRYHVEPVKHDVPVVQNGKTYNVKDYTELNVHEKILSGRLVVGDLPDIVDFESKQAWTLDECEAYVASLGTAVPERFLKRTRQEGRTDETDEPAHVVSSLDALPVLPTVTAGLVQSDDIPF